MQPECLLFAHDAAVNFKVRGLLLVRGNYSSKKPASGAMKKGSRELARADKSYLSL